MLTLFRKISLNAKGENDLESNNNNHYIWRNYSLQNTSLGTYLVTKKLYGVCVTVPIIDKKIDPEQLINVLKVNAEVSAGRIETQGDLIIKSIVFPLPSVFQS